jgi:hypothetical protein
LKGVVAMTGNQSKHKGLVFVICLFVLSVLGFKSSFVYGATLSAFWDGSAYFERDSYITPYDPTSPGGYFYPVHEVASYPGGFKYNLHVLSNL